MRGEFSPHSTAFIAAIRQSGLGPLNHGYQPNAPAPYNKTMAKWLITLGIVLVALGVLWPLFAKLGLGHLPGDIRIERKGGTFYFPITSSLVISALVSLILWLFRR